VATIVTVAPPVVEVGIAKGSTKTLELSVIDAVDAPVNLTGAIVTFTVKKSITDVTAQIVKSSTDVDEILITNPTGGVARIFLIPTDTSTKATGRYIFDIWVELSGGKKYQVIGPSTFTINPAVTP